MHLILAADVVATSQPLTIYELVLSGGWVMIPLLLCSIIALALIVYLFTHLKTSLISSEELHQKVDQFVDGGNLQGLLGYAQGRSDAVSKILTQTLLFLEKHPQADAKALEAIAEAEGGKTAASINQKVIYLMDLGALAPMLGLFGTVIGILRSFGSIALESSPMRTMLLAGGVSQALVATAAGLIIGITAMFFYSFFRGKVQGLISHLEIEASRALQPVLMLRKSR